MTRSLRHVTGNSSEEKEGVQNNSYFCLYTINVSLGSLGCLYTDLFHLYIYRAVIQKNEPVNENND